MKLLTKILPLLLIAALLLVGCTQAKNPTDGQDSSTVTTGTEDATTAAPTEQDAIEVANKTFASYLTGNDNENLGDPVCKLNDSGYAWEITRSLKDGSKSWVCTVVCSDLTVAGFNLVQENDEP